MMMKPFDQITIDKVRDMSQGGMDMMLKSVGTVSKTAQTMGIEWVDYAKDSMGAGTAAMQALAKAPTPQAAMEIQTAYLKSAYERSMAQAKTMAELYQGLAKDMMKPFEGMIPGKAAATA
ncbi:MAG: phasin family protein [Methylobacterium sp.]|nr:phasin family protein [Methylobacterium sp.]